MIKLDIKIQMADTTITESAQIDTAKPMSENLREATPAKSSPEQNIETIDDTFATKSGSKINKINDEEQQPLESSEKISKRKDINSGDKSEHRESNVTTPKKSRNYRNVSSSKSDDEEMEQHNKNSNKKDKSPTDRKTWTDGSNETSRKRSREDPSDTPRKHQRNRSKESSKERSEKHSDEKSGTHSRERREKSRDGHHSESKSPGKEKEIKSHGNNSSQSPQKSQETLNSTAVKKTPQKQKIENTRITNLSPKGTPQKKKDEKKTRFSPILFDEPKKTDASRSWRKEDSLKLLKQDWKLDKKEHFWVFFGKDAPFSNFHPAQFTVDGVIYTCSEQFMMHQKAGEISNSSPQHCKGSFYFSINYLQNCESVNSLHLRKILIISVLGFDYVVLLCT